MRRPDTPENRSARPESALLLGRMPCGSVAQTTRATPLGRACRSAKPDEFEPASPAEEAGEAAKVVRTMARNLREGREFSVTEQHQELVAAVRELAQVLNAAVAAAPSAATAAPQTGGNRAQRRAAKRRR